MKRSTFLLLDHHDHAGEDLSALYGFLLEHARIAEAAGFEALWLAEHHFERLGSVPSPAVALGAVAASTRSLRLGPAVSVLPYRDPIFVAEDYALVDRLSNGRLNMGVGCGSQPGEFAGLGVAFDSRWDVFHERLNGLRELWTGTALNVAPCQQPHPPFYVATTNPGNARAVGRNGDSVITLLPPGADDLRGVGHLVAEHREGLREGGFGKRDAEVVVVQLAHVAATQELVRREVLPALARLLSLLSPGAQDIEAIYANMCRGATGCFGTPAEAADVLLRLQDEGVGHVAFFSRFGGMDATAAHRSLERLATVVPAAEQREATA